jgi:hypothetical protein
VFSLILQLRFQMQASQVPTKIPVAFATSGTKNAIPTASQIGITAGAASLTDGFPPLTFTPISSGGVPPAGADFNGILNLISAIGRWQSAGGLFPYDATFSTSIGGYPKGALLISADGSTEWLCTVDNNTTNPDTGGANWLNASVGRLLNIQQFTSSGTYTPTPGTTSIIVDVVGGGGGGGGSTACATGQSSAGGGGGGGAFGKSRITAGFAGTAVTIGAAGAGGTAGGGVGGNGGTSSFGAFVSAPGNFGSNGGVATTSTGIGNGTGLTSTPTGSNIISQAGGQGLYGFSGVSGPSNAVGGQGGASGYGPGGGGASGSGGGGASPSYGGGGGGASTGAGGAGQVGGNGRGGIVTIYEYA